ncbi:MAG: DUF58 domain-containing protein [Acidimicrobiales bacterium]
MVPIPTARLAALSAAASMAILFVPGRPPVGLLAVDGFLVLAALVDFLLAADPASIGVERTLPPTLTLGGTRGVVRWAVSNRGTRRLRVAVADELAPSLRATARRLALTVPPRATVTAEATITPSRRGRFEPREVVVRVDGPLGLTSRQRKRNVPGRLRVLPAFPSRREAEVRIERALTIGIRSARSRGGGTEFESLREYGPDDEFRRIDWSATARAGRPIVRTYRAERNQQIVVLLDTGRGMAGQVSGVPRLEHAMDAAMALVAVGAGMGDRCGLVAFDRGVRAIVAPGAGTAQLGRIVDALYELGPRLVESDYRAAFTATLGRFRRRSLLVVITELTEEALAESLFPALGLLLSRHLVIVAAVADPDVRSWATASPADASETFRSAAAAQAVARRQELVARLRSSGVIVVDGEPAAVAGQLADAYLDLKGAGQL